MAGDRQILIRVDDDIYNAVKAAAKDEDRSMAAVARETLRARFDPPKRETQLMESDGLIKEPRPSPRAPLRKGAVPGRGAVPENAPRPSKKCAHPITARIGNACADCGATV